MDFESSHLDYVHMRDFELERYGADYLKERVDLVSKVSVISKTFMCEGEILCCAGFHWLHPGVAEGWIVPSTNVSRYPRAFGKEIRKWISGVFKDYDCHRFQTTSASDKLHRRWMKFLGFEEEGIMREFTHNRKDIVLYGRLRNGN